MSGQHTKGPWRFERTPYGKGTTRAICARTNEIARLTTAYYSASTQDANAHLIAAAPELLSVVLDMFQNPQFQVAVGGNPIMVDALMERARAAIAKATHPLTQIEEKEDGR